MPREHLPTSEELGQLALILARQFIQRWDRCPVQRDDGRYMTRHEPLQTRHLVAHLKGEITLGTYLLDRYSRARFVVLDADDEAAWQHLTQAANDLAEESIAAYLEHSRRGGHLWLFFSRPIPGQDARRFGRGIMICHNLDGLELFPKQDRLATGPGSLIRLPFGVHHRSGRRYGFVTPTGQPLASTLREQLKAFTRPLTMPQTALDGYMATASSSPVCEPLTTPEQAMGETLSERIKASVSLREFIGQYVRLNASGQGLCPFHDDQRPSFSINDQESYWHCFTCGIGGSIIDFHMRYHDVDFCTAVKELAKELL